MLVRTEKQIIEVSIDILQKELVNCELSNIERYKREQNLIILQKELKEIQ